MWLHRSVDTFATSTRGSCLTAAVVCLSCALLCCLQLDRLGHARGGDVTGRIQENLYDGKLLQQKLGHLQVRNRPQQQLVLNVLASTGRAKAGPPAGADACSAGDWRGSSQVG